MLMVRAVYKGNNENLTFRVARNELNKKDVEITSDGVKGKVKWKEAEGCEGGGGGAGAAKSSGSRDGDAVGRE